SDGPSEIVSLFRFENQLESVKQFKQNITEGKNFLENTDSVLSQATDVVQRARELAVRGANDSLNEEARENIANEINQRLEELVDLANSKIGGKYLFGGSETEISGDLFTVRRNGDGEIVEVTYNGDTNSSKKEVGDGEKVTSNLIG
ncbi:MAG: hypothetical protein ABEJ65_08020, partial [bacterium]